MEFMAKQNGNARSTVDRETLDQEYSKLRQEIQSHGHELNASQSVFRVLDRLQIEADSGEVDLAIDSLMKLALEESRPVEGAPNLLRKLSDQGITIGVVSSAVHHPFLEWALNRFEMSEAIAYITTSASSGYYKSRPEIYLRALEYLGADPGRSVHVGDSRKYDVTGAQRAGMRAIWFSRGRDAAPGDGHYPEGVVDSMSDPDNAIIHMLLAGSR